MDKREAILEAALTLFAERGYHGTSVAQIAEKAHVGAGTIYRYFKDKGVLVNVLYQEHKRNMAETVISGMQQELPPRSLFHRVWRSMSDFARHHPKVLMFLEFHHHAPYMDQASRDLEIYFKKKFYAFFETWREAQITKDVAPEILMNIIIGAFNRLEKAFLEGEIEPTEENEAMAEELCWEAIRR